MKVAQDGYLLDTSGLEEGFWEPFAVAYKEGSLFANFLELTDLQLEHWTCLSTTLMITGRKHILLCLLWKFRKEKTEQQTDGPLTYHTPREANCHSKVLCET